MEVLRQIGMVFIYGITKLYENTYFVVFFEARITSGFWIYNLF